MKINFRLAVTCFVLVAAIPAASATTLAEPMYNSGMQHFKAGNYGHAYRFFHQAASRNPDDPVIRYYLANCLVHLSKHDDAIEQYKTSYELDPYSIVSGFCRKALLAYNVPIQAVPKRVARRATRVAPKKFQRNRVSEEKVETIDDSNRTLFDAKNLIRRQTENEKTRSRDFAEELSKNALKAGKHRASIIKQDAEEDIKSLLSGAPILDSRGTMKGRMAPVGLLRPEDQEVVRAQADQIRREAAEKAKQVEEGAEERSRNYRQWSLDRQDRLDEVADNLESQLRSSKAPHSISINPVGTGLFVRNYNLPEKSSKYGEVRPSVVRFVDSLEERSTLVRSGSPSSVTAPGDDLSTGREVTGRLLD